MAKPVTSGIFSTDPFQRPANITPRMTLISVKHLPPLPSSPSASPRDFTPLKKPTALDIAKVKKLMREARGQIAQKHKAKGIGLYEKVTDLLSSSILDTTALLISASCYIIQANFWRKKKPNACHFIDKARVHLEEISKKLWDPTCPETKSCSFMYSLGCAQLSINYNSSDPGPHQKNKKLF